MHHLNAPSQRALAISKELDRLIKGDSFSGLSNRRKTEVVISIYLSFGREVQENWSYSNAQDKIPFVFASHKQKEWVGIAGSQSWSKFLVGQEVQYQSLSIDERIKYVRNILSRKFEYILQDRLNLELAQGLSIRKQKISLYCPGHGWNEPVHLSSFIHGISKGSCTRCLKEESANSQRLDIDGIIEEWHSLGRRVEPGQVYVNNQTRIRFFSAKYSWPASQTWDSYDQAKKKARSRLSHSEWKKYDPHDERSLLDKSGYLSKLIADYNQKHSTGYRLDPDWLVPEDLGKKTKIRVIVPVWRSYVAEVPWQDFLEYDQRPIFKSLVDKTSYIREVFLDSGRLILDGWKYNGRARDLIPFRSSELRYEGMIFSNSWNQVSNGLGFSVQAMTNKSEYYAPLFTRLGYKLSAPINNSLPMSQGLTVECSLGHKIVGRRLYDFVLAPEGFCKECANHRPDNLKTLLRNPDRSSQRAYLYYVIIKDLAGVSFKKLGITRFADPKLRFPSGFCCEQILLVGDVLELSRIEVCALEYALLRETSDWFATTCFSISDNPKSTARFPGYTELRDFTLPDQFVSDLIDRFLFEIQACGWARFWLKNLPASKATERKLLQILIDDDSWEKHCLRCPLPLRDA